MVIEKKAIQTAILNAEPNEIVLVAGKGHEVQQIYKNKIIKISDKKIIKRLKIKTINLSKRYNNFTQNKKILREITKNKNLENFHGLSIDTKKN